MSDYADDRSSATKFRRDREMLAQALNEAAADQQLVATRRRREPYGLWKVKPECEQKLAAQKKVSDFADERPAWIDVAKPADNAPVYMMSPGAPIYRHVCINCHGPNADGKGLQVDLLAAASEGEARPANFRERPVRSSEQPLANILPTFDVSRSGDIGDSDALGIALHGVDGAGRHAQANSSGHPPARGGDADAGRAAARISPPSPAPATRPATC